MAVYKNTPKMQDTDIERERRQTDRQTDRIKHNNWNQSS